MIIHETSIVHPSSKIDDSVEIGPFCIVGENVEIGVYNLSKALVLADQIGLDLVEISPKASPPVCKIVDYKKFLYEQKKREKNLKSKTTKQKTQSLLFR